MAFKAITTNDSRRDALWGAVSIAMLGLALMVFKPTGQCLTQLSHDLGFLFRPDPILQDAGVVIVSMDETSRRHFPAHKTGLWDRALHADLLQSLDDMGASAVVFDVWFQDPWPDPAVDERFARALIDARCEVVLAAHLPPAQLDLQNGLLTDGLLRAIEPLGSAAAWGVMEQSNDSDGVIRRLDYSFEYPNLAWRTAQRLGHEPGQTARDAWINYYGPPQIIPTLPYHKIFETWALPEDMFRGKTVFIGAGSTSPQTQGTNAETGVYKTPLTRWTGHRLSGVEIHATTFLNLIRNEWLNPAPRWLALILITLAGAATGYGFTRLRPYAAVVVGLHGVFLIGVGVVLLVRARYTDVPWLILAGIQIPAAVAWSVLANTGHLSRVKTLLETRLKKYEPLTLDTKTSPALQPSGLPIQISAPRNGLVRTGSNRLESMPRIADHTLLRCIGRGSYGEIWLARNTVGLHHAVKVVYRGDFEDPAPYEREFHGIKQFMPISRSHASFVHILHVGRDDAAGYFYYVMEAGDDEMLGQAFDPNQYSPKNLARHVRKHQRLDPVDCVFLGLILTNGLEYLHKQKLIHRDIKPSNIIYVNGRPKFADIGLVTQVGLGTSRGTFIGTPGYIPPEGPGRPTADIYSLGKVLYEAGMGRSRLDYPDIPTTMVENPAAPAFKELNQVILKACEANVTRRYQSASEMHADLLKIQIALCSKPPPLGLKMHP